MENKIKIIENLRYSFNLLRRNKHQNIDGMRGRDRLFSLLEQYPDGITQRELADQLRIQPPSMSELIQKLELQGLITKKQDENDRRSVKVFLTEQGQAKASEVQLEKSHFVDNLFNNFSVQEVDQLAILLEKFNQSLKDNVEFGPDEMANPKRHHSGHYARRRHVSHDHSRGERANHGRRSHHRYDYSDQEEQG